MPNEIPGQRPGKVFPNAVKPEYGMPGKPGVHEAPIFCNGVDPGNFRGRQTYNR